MSETFMTELNSANKQIASWADTGNVFQPLALRAMFWRPTYLEPSAWLEHIPFAFWLIEAHQPRVFVELGTHQGASYFAFCQAVDRLGLDAQCFAVDTWKGDEHAGFYDEQVFEKVKAHNAAQYSGFSRLVRSTFDEAVRHFTDGSIDLLHIDGLHTLEAVRHDFDTWLPKLSKRGVVVMHDTNVRERNFGVFKLFEQLHAQYPSFEFVHGHGLGVVGVGPDQEERLKHLFKSNESEPAKRSIHEVFSRLGLACADSLASVQQQARARKLEDEVSKQKKQLEETKQSLEKTKADLSTRSKELADTRSRVQTQIEHHAVERGQLVERATLLQELRNELKEEVGRLQGRIDATSTELSQRIQTLARLEEASARYQQQCHSLSEDLQRRDSSIEDLRRQAQKLQREMSELLALLRERDWELNQVKSAQQTQGLECAQLREERARLMEQQAASQQQLQALSAEVQIQRHLIGTLRDDIEQYKTAAGASQTRLVERERELVEEQGMREAQARELSDLRESGTGQSSRIESLMQALAHRDRELSNSQAEVAERREEVADLKQALEWRIAEHARSQEELQNRLKAQEGDLERLERAQLTLQSDKDALARRLEERLKEVGTLTQMLTSREAQVQQLQQDRAALHAEKENLAHQLQQKVNVAENASLEHAKALEQLQAKLKAQEAEVQRLVREKAALQSEQDTLGRKLEERFKEVGTLTQMLTAQEGQVQQLQQDKAALHAEKESLAQQLKQKVNVVEKANLEHANAIEQLQAKLKVQEAEVQRLVREKTSLQGDKETLARKLEERFKEVATLTKMLDTSDKTRTEADLRHAQEQEELLSKLKAREAEAAQLLAHKQSESSKWSLRLFARGGKKLGRKDKRKIACQVQLVKQCDLFDETWYLTRYPDIAQTKVDPLEHYLRFGAAEGRDPGPLFSTESYIRAYPDVAASAINPLVHYIQHGRQEGRTIERAKR